MFTLPHQHERIAQGFEDLAMNLDAGLDLHSSLGIPPSSDGRSMVESIAGAGPALEQLDRRVLEAAERAGDLPRALRNRAAFHHFQAEALMLCGKKLAYPALVLCLAAATLILISVLGYVPSAGRVLAIAIVILALIGFAVRHYLQGTGNRPEWDGRRVPGLHGFLWDHGLLPYLDALHALYRSGVPIHEAHQEATKVSPVAWVRMRLARASHDLSAGLTLSDALAKQAALTRDSQALLAKGERSGSLEECLHRAAEIHRLALRRRISRATTLLGSVLYLAAVLAVVFVAASFYSSYFASLSRRL